MLPEARWIGAILFVVGILMLILDVKIEHGHIELGAQQSFRERLLAIAPKHWVLAALFAIIFGSLWYFQRSQVTEPQLQKQTSIPSPLDHPQKAYDLTGARRNEFLELLATTQSEPRDILRIGCISGSDAACVAAGKFLILFSEAGWKIDSNRVYRMEPDIPSDGMTIATHDDNATNRERLPPHLGRWARIDPSHTIILMAFTQMDIPVLHTADPTLPPQTLGIYFGPEPTSTPIGTPAQKTIRKELIGFLSKANEVERVCSHGPNKECKDARVQWEGKVSIYLVSNGLESSLTSRWKELARAANPRSSPLVEISKQKRLLAEFFFGLIKHQQALIATGGGK